MPTKIFQGKAISRLLLLGIAGTSNFWFVSALVGNRPVKRKAFLWINMISIGLLNPNESGSRPSDSCINRLLAITHEIFESFDCNSYLEVRSVFLDISKAFDKGIYGYLRRTLWNNWTLTVRKIPESHFKWTNIIMVTYFRRCPPGLNFGPTSFSYVYQWFTQWIKDQCKTLFWWHLSIYCRQG